MAIVVATATDRHEVARAILASPDAEARVAALLAAVDKLNASLVHFFENPTRCSNADDLAFAQSLMVEVSTRLIFNEPDPLPRELTDRMRGFHDRAGPVIATTHRACVFASTVWNAAGGECAAGEVSIVGTAPTGGSKPH